MNAAATAAIPHQLREAQTLTVRGFKVRIVRIQGDAVLLKPEGWGTTIPVLRDRLLEEITASN